MSKKKSLLIAVTVCAAILTGCESKVSEREAEGFNDNTTAEYRVQAQTELDNRVNQLQNYVSKTKQLIETVQAVITSEKLASMSLFDVIYQVNSKIQNQMPRLKNEKLYVYGQFELATSLLTEECKKFRYTLTAESVSPLNELNYGMTSCYANTNYLNVITVKFDGPRMDIEFNDQNLKQILPPKILYPQITECSFSSDSSEATVCKDIMFAQSTNLVWFADLVSQGRTEVSVRGLSKKSGTLIYEGKVKLSAKGKIDDVSIRGPLATEEI